MTTIAGGSNYIASTLQENNLIPSLQVIEAYNTDTINIKTIEQRIIEISLSGLGAYTVIKQSCILKFDLIFFRIWLLTVYAPNPESETSMILCSIVLILIVSVL